MLSRGDEGEGGDDLMLLLHAEPSPTRNSFGHCRFKSVQVGVIILYVAHNLLNCRFEFRDQRNCNCSNISLFLYINIIAYHLNNCEFVCVYIYIYCA